MDTYTSEELQKLLSHVISDVVDRNCPCKVTSQEGNIILLSEETYQNLLVTLEFLSTPGLMDNLNIEEALLSEALC